MSSRLDSHPAYQEFLDWVRDNSQPGLIDPASDVKRLMLDANVLQTYFKANNHYRLNKLLRIAFPVGDIPIGPEKVADNCAQVFCTLVLIGRPEYIQRFVEYDHLQDSHLPFDDQYPPRHFPKCTTDQDQSEFLRRFCQKQWVVCAPKIDFREHRIFEDGQILPFKLIKRLGGGVSAHLYEIEICPTYNQLNSSNGAQQVSRCPFCKYVSYCADCKYYSRRIIELRIPMCSKLTSAKTLNETTQPKSGPLDCFERKLKV
jgi:hypothetical protein